MIFCYAWVLIHIPVHADDVQLYIRSFHFLLLYVLLTFIVSSFKKENKPFLGAPRLYAREKSDKLLSRCG